MWRMFFGFCLAFGTTVQAAQIQFSNITDGDLNAITKEFSSNFMHTSVSGANTLGLFGFEVGVLGGVTSTPNLNRLVQTASPGAESVNHVANAVLFGALSIPAGFTFEASLMPTVGSSELKYSTFTTAVKWTMTETVLSELPLSLALKFHNSLTKVTGNTVVSSVPTTLKFSDFTWGLQAMASKDFIFAEPYVALGFVSATGKLSTEASSVFASGASESSSTATGMNFLLGTEFKMTIVRIGLEYGNTLGANRYSAKLSLAF